MTEVINMRSAIIVFPDDSVETVNGLIDLCSGITESTELLAFGDDGVFQKSGFPASGNVSCIHWFKGPAVNLLWDLAPHARILTDFIKKQEYELVVSSAGENGDRISPMLSVMLGGSCITGLTGLHLISGKLWGTKSVYNMNLKARFIIKKRPAVVSIMDINTAKQAAAAAPIPVTAHVIQDNPAVWYSDLKYETSGDTGDIKNSKKLVVVGRGINDKTGYAKAEELAQLLEAKLGSTRPLVQEAIAPQSRLIGVSGAIASPEKCLILGASGAAPFAVGVEKSGTIYGVNNDPDAFLFSFCDFGVVDDCNLVTESLIELLKDGGQE